ncbi:hypothetical protein BC629DRAFT_1462349 [Irpex lacteus]|nr:hypothetical protein BC629DRAFT_1462349 [Irpex lacteus]
MSARSSQKAYRDVGTHIHGRLTLLFSPPPASLLRVPSPTPSPTSHRNWKRDKHKRDGHDD